MTSPVRSPALLGLAGAMAAAVALYLLRPLGRLEELPWFLLVIVPAMLLAHARWHALRGSWRSVITGALVALALVQGFRTARDVAWVSAHPPEWDFASFWVAGHAAVSGLDFYDPDSYHRIIDPLDYSEGFKQEILNVGFWYPPPTMVMLLPIGGLDVPQASRYWYGAQCLALAGAAVLVAWLFFGAMGPAGVALSIGLVTLLPGTASTFAYGQINALALLWLLLCWKNRDRTSGGVWLALAIATKPVAAILIGYALFHRRWRMLGGVVLGAAAAFAASVGAFGWDVTTHYIIENPVKRLPSYVFTQSINQSLPAAILRATEPSLAGAVPYTKPWALLGCALVVLVTLVVARFRSTRGRTAFALFVSAALLVYPATLVHYSLFAIVPMLSLWADRPRGGRATAMAAGLAGIVVAATAVEGQGVFAAHLMLWAGIIAITLLKPAPEASVPPASA